MRGRTVFAGQDSALQECEVLFGGFVERRLRSGSEWLGVVKQFGHDGGAAVGPGARPRAHHLSPGHDGFLEHSVAAGDDLVGMLRRQDKAPVHVTQHKLVKARQQENGPLTGHTAVEH